MAYHTETAQLRQRWPLTSSPGRVRLRRAMMSWRHLNAILGSVVVTLGFWLVWGELPVAVTAVFAVVVVVLLLWLSPSIGAIWGWATAVLGLESLAWPIVLMVQLRRVSVEPTEQELGTVFAAILFGVFSAVFWLTFSYGIFKKLRSKPER